MAVSRLAAARIRIALALVLFASDGCSFQTRRAPLVHQQAASLRSSRTAIHRCSARNRALRGAIEGETDPPTTQQLPQSEAIRVPKNANATTSGSCADIAPKKLYPATPTFKECLAFALPALGIYVCSPLMSLIDASFVGRASSLELAALGPASSISDAAPLPLLFLSIASTNLIAKSHAEADVDATARVARTAVGAGGACGAILASLLYFAAAPISALYCGGGGSLAPLCAEYVAIRALALPAVVITTIAQAVCIGTKDTRTPMISVALAGALNLVGDLVLVKFLGRGIAGAAWATSFSQILSAGLLLRVLDRRGFLRRVEGGDGTIETVKQLLKFVPFLFVMAVKIGWHNSCSATAASLGGVRAAAHTALISVAMICMVLGDVGSSLSQAFLPPFAVKSEDGKGASFDMDAAMPTIKQLLKCTLSISATVMCVATLLIGVFGGQITSDQQVLAEMRRTLPWIVATLGFHGSAVTLEGVLLSRRRFRGLTANYAVLAVGVAAFQMAIRKFNLGLAGVWGCYLWFCSSRVVTFSALGGLFRRRRRSAKEVVA